MTHRELMTDIATEVAFRAGTYARVASTPTGYMSTGLPDFTAAPAWMDALGGVVAQRQVMDYRGSLSDFSAGAPWEPLRTADEWGQRIDRDALALEIALTPDPSHAGMGTRHVGMDWAREMADAILAALPELMGGVA